MQVELSPEDHATLESLVASGHYESKEEALHAGIVELAENEAENKRIRGLVQEALDTAAKGEIISGDDFLRERYEARLKRA